jgi:hypothetical protein
MTKKHLTVYAILLLTVPMAAADLAGYWAFDEGSGMTVADSSGNGKNGVLHSANKANYPQWTTGHNGTGSALRFNSNTVSSANSNRVVIDPNTLATDPNQPGLTNLGKAFTISMWVRRDAVDYFNNLYPNLVSTTAYNIQLALIRVPYPAVRTLMIILDGPVPEETVSQSALKPPPKKRWVPGTIWQSLATGHQLKNMSMGRKLLAQIFPGSRCLRPHSLLSSVHGWTIHPISRAPWMM